jgi:hypothetical protein
MPCIDTSEELWSSYVDVKKHIELYTGEVMMMKFQDFVNWLEVKWTKSSLE